MLYFNVSWLQCQQGLDCRSVVSSSTDIRHFAERRRHIVTTWPDTDQLHSCLRALLCRCGWTVLGRITSNACRFLHLNGCDRQTSQSSQPSARRSSNLPLRCRHYQFHANPLWTHVLDGVWAWNWVQESPAFPRLSVLRFSHGVSQRTVAMRGQCCVSLWSTATTATNVRPQHFKHRCSVVNSGLHRANKSVDHWTFPTTSSSVQLRPRRVINRPS